MDFGNLTAIAIVGSRSRKDRAFIEALVDALPAHIRVVSGGCKNSVDAWAVERAKARGMATTEHLPDLKGVRSRGESAQRYYDRNQKVVDDSDAVVAFVGLDRKGGTEDTIKRAIKAGKPVIIK